MANKKHWSEQIAEAYEKKQRPSYEVLEEAVAALLEERQVVMATLKDMTKQMGDMIFARHSGDTNAVLSALDGLIAKHVTFMNAPAPVVH